MTQNENKTTNQPTYTKAEMEEAVATVERYSALKSHFKNGVMTPEEAKEMAELLASYGWFYAIFSR